MENKLYCIITGIHGKHDRVYKLQLVKETTTMLMCKYIVNSHEVKIKFNKKTGKETGKSGDWDNPAKLISETEYKSIHKKLIEMSLGTLERELFKAETEVTRLQLRKSKLKEMLE